MLRGQVLDLIGLFTDDVSGMRKVRVNHLLVLEVGQRTEESDTGGEKRQAPERKKLDQVIGQESRQKRL